MKQFLRITGIVTLFLFLTVTGMAQSYNVLDHDGTERAYTVRLPDGYDETASYPLMIVLHGFGDSAINFQTVMQLDDLAYAAGWITVFPEGANAAWYYLDEDQMLAGDQYQDDVTFMNLLLDDLQARYAVDEQRVFVVGFSNGGLMALRAGCDLRDRLAGVAAIAATYAFELTQHCMESEPLPELIVWGSTDETFPFNGYAVVSQGVMRTSFSQNQLRTYLSSRHGCQPEVISVETANSPLRVISLAFAQCTSAQPALVYIIGDLGHAWLPEGIEIQMLNPDNTGDIEDAIFEFLQIVSDNAAD